MKQSSVSPDLTRQVFVFIFVFHLLVFVFVKGTCVKPWCPSPAPWPCCGPWSTRWLCRSGSPGARKKEVKDRKLNPKGLRQEVQNTNLQEESVACLLLDSSGNSVINLVIFMPKMPLNWFHLLRVAIKKSIKISKKKLFYLLGLVTRRSSPTIWIAVLAVSLAYPSQSSWDFAWKLQFPS